MKRSSKLFTVVLIVALMAAILSSSIAVPLLWRGFYYLHIDALDLPEHTGYAVEEIRGAFDEMMDYCVFGEPFGTGVLKWSQSGYEHFADCAKLFRLDFTVALISAVILLILLILCKRGVHPVRLVGKGAMFWAGSVLSVGFIVIAGLAAMNFDKAFVIFHTLFFPGKTNWIFDYRTDEIINILPQVFFRNCALLIVGVLFAACIGLIIADRIVDE